MKHLPAKLENAVELGKRYGRLALEARRIEFFDGIGEFAMRDVGPRSDNLGWLAGCIPQNLKGVLKPTVVPRLMQEAVFEVAAALRYQAPEFLEYMGSILRVRWLIQKLGSANASSGAYPMIWRELSLANVHAKSPEALVA